MWYEVHKKWRTGGDKEEKSWRKAVDEMQKKVEKRWRRGREEMEKGLRRG